MVKDNKMTIKMSRLVRMFELEQAASEATAVINSVNRDYLRGYNRQMNGTRKLQKKFPEGSKVRSSEPGSSPHTVIGHNHPMVYTTGGDFHHTKICKASIENASKSTVESHERNAAKVQKCINEIKSRKSKSNPDSWKKDLKEAQDRLKHHQGMAAALRKRD